MGWAGCEGCPAPADLVGNYDTLRCWECWDEGGWDKPDNLVIRVVRDREASDPSAVTGGEADDER
jgi:hypothetical protein